MRLNELQNNKGSTAKGKRVGRGIGSGKGKTSGAGHKGQKARSGVAVGAFEGGQQPIYRRLPKRGFVNIFRQTYQVVNLSTLQRAIDDKKIKAGDSLDQAKLFELGLISKKNAPVKLLAKGELKAKLSLQFDAASEAAVKAVKKAGGELKLPQAA
jgi:large subunit ribosomal protein L15